MVRQVKFRIIPPPPLHKHASDNIARRDSELRVTTLVSGRSHSKGQCCHSQKITQAAVICDISVIWMSDHCCQAVLYMATVRHCWSLIHKSENSYFCSALIHQPGSVCEQEALEWSVTFMNDQCSLFILKSKRAFGAPALCIAFAGVYTQTGQSQSSKRSFIIMNKQHWSSIRKATFTWVIQPTANSNSRNLLIPAAVFCYLWTASCYRWACTL